MNQLQEVTERKFRLRVDGWRYARRAMVKGNALYTEIALSSCSHCSTCSNRIRTVESRLQGSDTLWSFQNSDGGLYLVVEPGQMPADVGNYMSGLLGLRISEC